MVQVVMLRFLETWESSSSRCCENYFNAFLNPNHFYFFQLRRCCVDDPSNACSVSIASFGISEAKTEDFALFDNVAYVNAAENFLSLGNLCIVCP